MGILLAPATGRGVAFAIIGVPLALFLLLGFTTSDDGSGAGGGTSGGYPFPQSQPLYPQSSQPAYPQATPTSVPTTSYSGFGAPDGFTDTPTVATGSTDATTDSTDATSDAATATETAIGTSTALTGGSTSSASSPSSPSPTPPSSPAAVVVTAYADLNRHDYQGAYNLGLGRNNQSYQSFVDGYATTASDTVTVTGVNGDVVSVSLVASKTDGSRHTYTGTYTVTGGVITGADIQQVN